MNNIEMYIPGVAIPQGRPRFRRFKDFVSTYDPKESKQWKKVVSDHAKGRDIQQFDRDLPLCLTITFYLPKPKSVKRQYPTVKPDLDNLTKAIKDALNGICWHDDGQICRLVLTKEYCSTGQPPGVWIGVREIKL